MAFRGFLVRHRIGSACTALAMLGVLAVGAASWTSTTASHRVNTQLTSSVTECHDMVTISVAGRNDTPVAGTTKMLLGPHGEQLPAALSGDHSSHWVDPVVNAPGKAVPPGSYAAVYIAYPANLNTYEDAVNTGVANTEQVMREISQACPNTRFSIVGYSEGSDVVRRVAMGIGHQTPGAGGHYGIVDPSHVVGVVILADAGRTRGDGPFPGAKDPFGHPDGFDQRYQNGTNPVPGQGALPGTSGDFGALNGKIASFCSDNDLTCAAPQNISLLQLAINVGRQLNIDAIQRDGLTPATGQDVAVVLGRIALAAFADIQSQPNWMQSDETFLQVLLRVSDPDYKPGQTPRPAAQTISNTEMSPLAYLPKKVFNEIIGLIVTNQNTIPVIMSDPYNLTLGPNGTGHHFDYWRDANPANGKPMTSAEYAAAWLTHLAKDAQAGKPIDRTAAPQAADVTAVYQAVAATRTTEPTTAATTSTATATAVKADAGSTSATSTTTTTAPTTTTTTTSPTTTTTTPPTTTTTTSTATTTSTTTTSTTTQSASSKATTGTTEPTTTTTDSGRQTASAAK